MRRNPTTLAWTVLLLSFLACVVLAFCLSIGGTLYVRKASTQQTARLEVLGGTVLYQQAGDRVEVGVREQQILNEGDSVKTTADSQAIVWLFDNSNIRLWPNSQLTVRTLNESRFSTAQATIALTLNQGHCRIEAARPPTEARSLEVSTPNAKILMREGSYSIEAATDSHNDDNPNNDTLTSQIVTHNGSASVTGAGKTVEVLRAERTQVEANQSPFTPTAAAHNLVQNGDFSQPLEVGWVTDTRSEDKVVAKIETTSEDGRQAAMFSRTGSTKHGEAYLMQDIRRDVTDTESLTLNLGLKVLNQSLSGGGWMGSEYPLMVRIRYRDTLGNDNLWVKGFYYQNKDGLPTTNGVLVPQNTWYQLSQAVDLFDPQIVNPRPAFITSIELVASGWDFKSLVTDVRLTAE